MYILLVHTNLLCTQTYFPKGLDVMQSHPTTAPTVKTLQPYLDTILNYESVVCEQQQVHSLP